MTVERELPEHEIDLAGIDVLALERREGGDVERGTMGAGHGGELDDLDRRLGIAERHVAFDVVGVVAVGMGGGRAGHAEGQYARRKK